MVTDASSEGSRNSELLSHGGQEEATGRKKAKGGAKGGKKGGRFPAWALQDYSDINVVKLCEDGSGVEELVELLNKGSILNSHFFALDSRGWTPLHGAASHGHQEVLVDG